MYFFGSYYKLDIYSGKYRDCADPSVGVLRDNPREDKTMNLWLQCE